MSTTVEVIKDCKGSVKADYKKGSISKEQMNSRLAFCSYTGYYGAENNDNWTRLEVDTQCLNEPCPSIVTYKNNSTGETISEENYIEMIREQSLMNLRQLDSTEKPTYSSPKTSTISILAPMVCLFVAGYLAYKKKSSAIQWAGYLLVGSIAGAVISRTATNLENR